MWTFITVAIALVVLWVLTRALGGLQSGEKPPRPQTQHHPTRTISIQTKMETRAYDHKQYRFDGTAFPQYRITYSDENGVVEDREIYVDDWRERGPITYCTCWSFLKDAERTFRSDRILKTVNLSTNRKIKDIASHIMR